MLGRSRSSYNNNNWLLNFHLSTEDFESFFRYLFGPIVLQRSTSYHSLRDRQIWKANCQSAETVVLTCVEISSWRRLTCTFFTRTQVAPWGRNVGTVTPLSLCNTQGFGPSCGWDQWVTAHWTWFWGGGPCSSMLGRPPDRGLRPEAFPGAVKLFISLPRLPYHGLRRLQWLFAG